MSIVIAPSPRIETANNNQLSNPFGINRSNGASIIGNQVSLARNTELNFTTITSSPEPAIQKIIQHYKTDGKPNTAVLSKDGNSLVVAITGQDAAAKLFNDSWFSKIWAKLRSAPNPGLVMEWYKNYYDPKTNPRLDYKSDDPSDLVKSLKANFYHSQILFKRDPATGVFDIKNPSFVSISDSYWFAAEHAKLGKDVQNRYRHYYTIDKTVANPNDKELMANTATIAESFFTALPKTNGLIVPFALKDLPNSRVLDWHFPLYTKDNKWVEEKGQVSFIRPAARTTQDIDPVIAKLDMQTRISSGDKLMPGYQEHKAIVDRCIEQNAIALSNI